MVNYFIKLGKKKQTGILLKPIRWTERDLNPYGKWVQLSQNKLFRNSL